MLGPFTEAQILQIEEEREMVSVALTTLYSDLATRVAPLLTAGRAREYLLHGVGRRLKVIKRCIDNIFTIFPVERGDRLNEDERSDLEINLQAFMIHVCGLQDNLAWVYVLEKAFEHKIERGRLGVGLFNEYTQRHLPVEVCAYLKSDRVKTWYERYAKNYRDALSHRIPLYVPPVQMTQEQEHTFQDLEAHIFESIKVGDIERSDALIEEQASIGNICAVFLQSYSDDDSSGPIYFHPQIIADGKIVVEIVNILCRHILPVT